MVYRIHYHLGSANPDETATVEASSPNDALVKFCHAAGLDADPNTLRNAVTSICAEDQEDLAYYS